MAAYENRNLINLFLYVEYKGGAVWASAFFFSGRAYFVGLGGLALTRK